MKSDTWSSVIIVHVEGAWYWKPDDNLQALRGPYTTRESAEKAVERWQQRKRGRRRPSGS